MTIEEIDELIDVFDSSVNNLAREAVKQAKDGDNTLRYHEAMQKYNVARAKLKEAIIEYGRESAAEAYHQGWREGAKNDY